MKQHPGGCIDWAIFLIFFVAVLTFACATLPPAQSIRDLKDISGKWETTIMPSSISEIGLYGGTGYGAGMIQQLQLALLINEDGTYEWKTSPGYSGLGKGQLSAGKYQIESKYWISGICALYEGGGKRILDCRSNDGKVIIQYVPASRWEPLMEGIMENQRTQDSLWPAEKEQ
jgi:hypothetical protein